MEVYYVQNKTSMIINTILMVIVGVLFIIDKDLALELGFIVAGICLIIAGLIPMIMVKNVDAMGIVMIILGIVLLLVPNLMADITTVIIGVVAIIVGALIAFGGVKAEGSPSAFTIVVGILIALAGILIFMGNDIAFLIFGVMLVVAGVVNIVALLKK
ncbi:MAG: DUF308 domain-containing protein [Candidatus Methanomethylophilaceae archaeon]|nr:DUF308 domain-containing protein [Candidatus Methanomethylophilaceae archaeon]MBR4203532.1 DUF308 domain-containing protein [Candidatus Methanomethylophilaceae archaeon]